MAVSRSAGEASNLQPHLAGLGLQIALVVAGPRVAAGVAALVALRIAQPSRLRVRRSSPKGRKTAYRDSVRRFGHVINKDRDSVYAGGVRTREIQLNCSLAVLEWRVK
jgi:hypothetical protein